MSIPKSEIGTGDRIRATLKGDAGSVTGVTRFNWSKLLVLDVGGEDGVTLPWGLVKSVEKMGRKFEDGLYVAHVSSPPLPTPEVLAHKVIWKVRDGEWDAVTEGVASHPAIRIGAGWEDAMVRLCSME